MSIYVMSSAGLIMVNQSLPGEAQQDIQCHSLGKKAGEEGGSCVCDVLEDVRWVESDQCYSWCDQ